MAHPDAPRTPKPLADVIDQEWDLIARRRGRIVPAEDAEAGAETTGAGPVDGLDVDSRLTAARVRALGRHVTGLSFSGGGIRSGTFAVGFLQGLASLGLLERFDYLSTVSGGGYAGGWLAAWLKREGSVANVQRQLAPSRVVQSRARREFLNPPPTGEPQKPPVVDEEPEPLFHLRSYSSYLTPRSGLLTADTWTVIAIWARNVVINLMMLLPAAMIVVLVARLVVYLYSYISPASIQGDQAARFLAVVLAVLSVLCLLVTFGTNARALGEFRRHDPRRRPARIASHIYYFVLYPAIGAAVLLTIAIRSVLWGIGTRVQGWMADALQSENGLLTWLSDAFYNDLGILGVPNVAGHAVGFGLLLAVGALLINARNGTLRWKYLYCAFLAGASGGVLLTLVEALLKWLTELERPDLIATFVPPAALLIFVAAVIVEVALLGRTITEAEREWWARFSALMSIAALLWTIALVTILYVPAAFLAAGIPLRVAIASGWLGTTAFGVLTGRYLGARRTGGLRGLATIAAVAPPVFLVGLLGAVALLVAALINVPPLRLPASGAEAGAIAAYLRGVRGTNFWVDAGVALLWLLGAWGLYRLGSRLIDVNLFSLHAMYANRLIRGYLGASRPKARWPQRWGDRHDPRADGGAPSLSVDPDGRVPPPRNENPVTGFDPDDDIPLLDLRIGLPPSGPGADRVYWGPHLLINATLNLVGGQELAWRDRKGESFVLSPLYCGTKTTGYAEVTAATRQTLTLGRAMTISGAAVDPNMSFYQSASLTALLTIFNARLGYWMENPSRADWVAESPKYGKLLMTEFLGRTVGRGDYVHLSDGGHFENLGVYELVRRRCRYIVAVDAGEDPDASDDNLAILIRLCRIDFGVRIQLDTTPLRREGPDRLTRTHVVVGRVRYDDVDNGQMPGVLVYVKISLTGDEPPDLQKYARKAPDFPHQATDLRQSFDEEQFECYRALGDHIARDVFQDAVHRLRSRQLWSEPRSHQDLIRGNQMLFAAVEGRWAEPPTVPEARALELNRAWIELQRDLRTDPALDTLARDLYPELPPPVGVEAAPAAPTGAHRAELHAVGQMLQVMEDAWINLGLRGSAGLAMNRGWMNIFRRWARSAAFRRLWPTLRSEFSPDFVQFCEVELHLTAAEPAVLRLPGAVQEGTFEASAVELLAAEFAREWPREVKPEAPRESRGLHRLVERAGSLGLDPPPVWLIVQAPSGPRPAGDSDEKFACGIILAADSRDEHDAAIAATYEFFAWVRGPYRSIGLGSRCIRPVLDAVGRELQEKHPGRPLALRVRYPKSGRDGDDDQERITWLNFFTLYDFRPLTDAAPRTDTVLELRIGGTAPPAGGS